MLKAQEEMDRKNAAAATAKREAEEAAAAKGSEVEDAGEPGKKKMVADGYGDGDDSEAEKISEKLTAEQREKLAKAAASKAGEEEEDGEHHTINLFNNEIKVPKKLTVPTPSPKPKKKYTPPPIPDVCDGEHCAGCLADAACEEHGDHCMWNKKKNVCYPKKIKLFGHEIDLTKLHNEEM